MAAEEPPRAPEIEDFLGEPTRDLEEWDWLWDGNHRFPLRSHRGRIGRLIVAFKKLLRPLVEGPQSDLWDRQRVFNQVLIQHLQDLHRGFDDLGRDIQKVQRELVRDVAEVQGDYLRDVKEITSRLEHLEEFKREGFADVMKHSDALFSRIDQKIDRFRRRAAEIQARIETFSARRLTSDDDPQPDPPSG